MDRNDFLPIERDTNIRESSFIVRPNWWQRFKVNRLAVVGACIIAVMIVLAIFGPMISPYTYADQSLVDANQSPSLSHWYVILLMVVIGPGLTSIFIALGIAYWLNMARIVRSQIVKVREEEYIIAAETMGIPKWRILWRHILPNCVGPIIITLTLAIPDAIFTEAFLSFIGLGVNAPMASWGVLASDGISSMRSYPFQLIFPALAISVTMLGFVFLGDGLRNVFDPKEGDR